jgi:hypothetical protein
MSALEDLTKKHEALAEIVKSFEPYIESVSKDKALASVNAASSRIESYAAMLENRLLTLETTTANARIEGYASELEQRLGLLEATGGEDVGDVMSKTSRMEAYASRLEDRLKQLEGPGGEQSSRPDETDDQGQQQSAPNSRVVPTLPLDMLPAVQPGSEGAVKLWVALGGKDLTDEVREMKLAMLNMNSDVTPGRWDDLRSRHADLTRMVAVLQDTHCHHIQLLWEDLRAVCQELGSIGAASGAAAAQAAAAQAAVVDTAAGQALTLWKELGTPRRAEIVGLVGEVRTLRLEVNALRMERAGGTEPESAGASMRQTVAPTSPTSPPLSTTTTQRGPVSSASSPSQVSPSVARVGQADDPYRVKAEIIKYAGAISHFKRYENVPVGELWEDAYADGFSYWRIMPSDQQGIEEVSRQARAGFDNAIEGGLTPESLALGLGRALTRFKMVPQFKPLVDPMVNAALTQLGRASAVAEPASGPNREYYVACRRDVMNGAIGELVKWNLIASDFKYATPGGADSPEMPRDFSTSPSSRAAMDRFAPTSADSSLSPSGSRRPNMKMWRSSLSKLSPGED